MGNVEKIIKKISRKIELTENDKNVISQIIHSSSYHAYLILADLECKLTNEQRKECIEKAIEDEKCICEIYHNIANENEKEILWQKLISSVKSIEIYLCNYIITSNEKKNQLIDILFESKSYVALSKLLPILYYNEEKTYKLIDLIIKEKDCEAAYNVFVFINNYEFGLSKEKIIELINIIAEDILTFKYLIKYQLNFVYNDYIVEKIVEQNDYDLAYLFKLIYEYSRYDEQLNHLILMRSLAK